MQLSSTIAIIVACCSAARTIRPLANHKLGAKPSIWRCIPPPTSSAVSPHHRTPKSYYAMVQGYLTTPMPWRSLPRVVPPCEGTSRPRHLQWPSFAWSLLLPAVGAGRRGRLAALKFCRVSPRLHARVRGRSGVLNQSFPYRSNCT
jgi:hypothetical protein